MTRVVALVTLRAFALALLAAGHPAQGLEDPYPPSNPEPIVYCPPERLASDPPDPFHQLNVFLPPGPAPTRGWPVVVSTGYGGGASVPPAPDLRSTGARKPLFRLLEDGIAVVHYGVPGVGGGRGLWFPPGHPSGRDESFSRADDSPEKSAGWVVQWVKVQALFALDPARVALRGSSGGAVLAVRTALGPDRARSVGSPALRASTHVAAVLALRPPTSLWALAQGPELGVPVARHLERADAPGVPADELRQVDPELQKAYSLMRVAFATQEARVHSARLPIALLYDDPVLRIDGQPATFLLDGSGFPVLYDALRAPTQHDAWFGYRFWRSLTQISPAAAAFHRSQSIFAVRDTSALSAPLNVHTHTFKGTVTGPEASDLAHDWLVRQLGGARPPLPVGTPTSTREAPVATLVRPLPALLELELPPLARWAWLELKSASGVRVVRVAPVERGRSGSGRARFALGGPLESWKEFELRARWWPTDRASPEPSCVSWPWCRLW